MAETDTDARRRGVLRWRRRVWRNDAPKVEEWQTPSAPLPALRRSWGPMPGAVDLQHSALLVAHDALARAGQWPYGPPAFDAQGRPSLVALRRMCEAQRVTLSLDADLGPDHWGMILYPTATIMLNRRYYGEWAATPRIFAGARMAIAMLLSIYLIHPPYSDVFWLGVGYESAVGSCDPIGGVLATAHWMALEIVAPGPLVCAIDAETAGSSARVEAAAAPDWFYRDALFAGCGVPQPDAPHCATMPSGARRLAERVGISPTYARLKYLATIAGAADALTSLRYDDVARAARWFPFQTPESAHAYAARAPELLRQVPPFGQYIRARETLRVELPRGTPFEPASSWPRR